MVALASQMADVSLPLVAVLGLVVIVGALLFGRRRGDAAPGPRGAAADGSPPADASVAAGSVTQAKAAPAEPTPSAAPAPPSPPAPSSPPYDPAEALELCGGDPEFLKTIFVEVPKECRERMADIRAAFTAGDAAAQRAAAHRMKGSLLLIAARPAAELARGLEHAGAAGQVGPEEQVEALARALEALYAAIARA